MYVYGGCRATSRSLIKGFRARMRIRFNGEWREDRGMILRAPNSRSPFFFGSRGQAPCLPPPDKVHLPRPAPPPRSLIKGRPQRPHGLFEARAFLARHFLAPSSPGKKARPSPDGVKGSRKRGGIHSVCVRARSRARVWV
jgi:hypothetical protein